MGEPFVSQKLNEILTALTDAPDQQQEIKQLLIASIQLDRLINNVSALLAQATLEQIPDSIQHALEMIGADLDVDRCFAFWIKQETNSLGEVYEWCQPDAIALKINLEGLPLSGFVWSLPQLQRFEPVCVANVAEMPQEAAVEAQQMAFHGTVSFACVPFRQGQKLLGWLSLEYTSRTETWDQAFVVRLQILADLIGNALTRFQTETALQKSEARTRAIVEDQTELICRFLSDGTLTFVNGAYCRYFDKTADDLIGDSFMPLIPEEDRPIVESSFSQLSLANPLITYEHRVIMPNGEIRWHEWTDRAIFDEHGTFVEFQAVGRDITKTKEAEMGLKRLNKELATAVATKDQFLANMSHELRTPLHTILLKAEMLRRGIYQTLNERQQKSVMVIEDSGRHLLSIINDVLDISKISAGRDELTIADVDIMTMCRATLQLVRELAQENNLKLFLNVDQDVSILQGDELRLKQVLVNLLSNSIKFTPDGGRIGLDVVGDAKNEQITLTVWDTGIGIAPEAQVRIFEPFAQVEGEFTRLGGTGLGLALVKRLVELHGGTIDLQSKLGEGSRFIISLPWQPIGHADEMAGLLAISESPSADAETVSDNDEEDLPLLLLAEDNETLVATLIDFFELQPLEVLVAGNGLQVLDTLEKKTPDVILMDVQMPFMDGLEATQRIRADERFADIPVIMVTAMAMPGDEQRCFDAGATAYLSKPLNLMQLMDTIQQQLAA